MTYSKKITHTFIALAGFVPASVFAQNAILQVDAGGTLNLENEATIGFKNGNLVNNGSINGATGRLLFLQDSAYIAGTVSPVVGKLELSFKNAGGVLMLQSNAGINNQLSFVKGILDLNGHKLELLNEATISGETETSRIIGTTGSVTKTVNLTPPNTLNPGNIGVEITSAADLGSTMIARDHEILTIEGSKGIQRNYTITPTNNTAVDAKLRFYYFDAELNNTDETKLQLWKTEDGLSWTNVGVDERNTTLNYVEKSGITSFSKWSLVDKGMPLPLTLLSYGASCSGDKATVSFRTSNEINVQKIVIERSANTSNWTAAGELAARYAGNGGSYSFTDNNPLGAVFYRLTIIDKDGTKMSSPVFAGGCSEFAMPVLLTPVPAITNLNLTYSVRKAGQSQVTIIAANGAKVYQQAVSAGLGINNVVIPVQRLTPGNYILQLLHNGKLEVKKFVKQ